MLSCRCYHGYAEQGQISCKIPLISSTIHAVIQNSLSTIVISQVFQNSESNPIECEYIFPIIEDSVVTSLRIYLPDGTVLTSSIEEKEKASEMYQDAISEGNLAIISNSDSPQRMCIVVGNLAPQESLRTEFILTAPLITEDCFWKLLIPAEFILVDRSNVVEFVFGVEITTNSVISSYSSNYPLVWESNGLIVTGRLNIQNQFTAEDSIWVKYQASNTNVPTCIIQKLENKFAAMMSFIPFAPDVSLNDAEGTGEFIFVLDRSGSMSGDSIELAKKAAILFLQSLPNGSYFNIVSFGSTFTKMYSSSQQNTSKITSKTIQQLENFQADMGGTDILEPLTSIFSESPCLDPPVNKLSKYFFGAGSPHECARSIFLLTDGQVSNNEEVIKLIKENARNSRVYGFGIGDGVDTGLITDSAKAGKGRAYFASNVETLGRLVISALQHSILPCVNSWEINWTGECYPPTEKIGNVYYGERCVQYILLDTLPQIHPVIKWYDNFTKKINQLGISEFQVLEGDQIFKLWAKHKIELLSDSNQTEEEVIQLSKEFQIPSPLTAFICVKQNSEAVVGDMQSIKIPVVFINKSSGSKGGCRSMGMLRSAPLSASEFICSLIRGILKRERNEPSVAYYVSSYKKSEVIHSGLLPGLNLIINICEVEEERSVQEMSQVFYSLYEIRCNRKTF